MKIYTKKGDSGETSLLGGLRVPKHHIRIEAYGTIDELNSFLGLLRDQAQVEIKNQLELISIQETLFTIGSHLAMEPGKTKFKLPEIGISEVEKLEQSIDFMNETLPEMKNFILPGGHPAVSIAHVARCVCRRAERLIVLLGEQSEVEDIVKVYINRLSDYLFVLARKLGHDLNIQETPWKPNG